MRYASILIILTALVTWVFPTVSATPADTPTDLKEKIEKLGEEVNTLKQEVDTLHSEKEKLERRIDDWHRDNHRQLQNLVAGLGHKLETKQNWQAYYDFYLKKMNDPSIVWIKLPSGAGSGKYDGIGVQKDKLKRFVIPWVWLAGKEKGKFITGEDLNKVYNSLLKDSEKLKATMRKRLQRLQSDIWELDADIEYTYSLIGEYQGEIRMLEDRMKQLKAEFESKNAQLESKKKQLLQLLAKPQLEPINLTGTWACSDGGTYKIIQKGNTVNWTGRSADRGQTWTHEFEGSITADGHIVGKFLDRAPGRNRNKGWLVVHIEGPNRLVKVAGHGKIKTNPVFGGREWTRAK